MMKYRNQWVERAYEFFCRMEQSGELFTRQDIIDATNYKPGVLKKYIKQKWSGWFLEKVDDEQFRCTKALHNYSKEEFVSAHSNKPMLPVRQIEVAPVPLKRREFVLKLQFHDNELLIVLGVLMMVFMWLWIVGRYPYGLSLKSGM